MEFLVIWLFCGIAAAAIATGKGRSGVGWFLLGVLLGPLALAVAFFPSAEASAQQTARVSGQADGYRKCPSCAEAIRAEAVKCRYCQSTIAPLSAPPAEEPGASHPLATLSPAHRTEAEQHRHTLAKAGYDAVKLATAWEMTNRAGRVVSVVSTLEELRAFAADVLTL